MKKQEFTTDYLDKYIEQLKVAIKLLSKSISKNNLTNEEFTYAMNDSLVIRGLISHINDELNYIKSEITSAISLKKLSQNPSEVKTFLNSLMQEEPNDETLSELNDAIEAAELDLEKAEINKKTDMLAFSQINKKNKNDKPN